MAERMVGDALSQISLDGMAEIISGINAAIDRVDEGDPDGVSKGKLRGSLLEMERLVVESVAFEDSVSGLDG